MVNKIMKPIFDQEVAQTKSLEIPPSSSPYQIRCITTLPYLRVIYDKKSFYPRGKSQTKGQGIWEEVCFNLINCLKYE